MRFNIFQIRRILLRKYFNKNQTTNKPILPICYLSIIPCNKKNGADMVHKLLTNQFVYFLQSQITSHINISHEIQHIPKKENIVEKISQQNSNH